MQAIVIGAGEVGFDVARLLAMEKHDVTVVDVNADALDAVRNRLDVLTIQGSGTSEEVLQHCNVKQADILIAVTTVDEVNLISCMLASRLGVKTTVARVRSGVISSSKSVIKAMDFGIDILIHPEESTAEEVTRLIQRANATDMLTFAGGRLNLVGMRLDAQSPASGMALNDLSMLLPDIPFRVVGITRGIRTLLPRGASKLQKNDQVFVLARPKHIPHVARRLGKSDRRIQRVMILGGSRIGALIAQHLDERKFKNIKLVEPDRERAEEVAKDLSNVLVIHADAADIDLLVTEGLSEMDAFVAVTEDEESNLVACLMAKHLGVKKTVALLSKGAYVPISQAIGLDAAVSKKLAISREILHFLRGKHVMSVATVHGLDAEILEVEARPRSAITKKSLADLNLPTDMIVGAVMRGKDVEVATGTTHIHAGDRVIVFVRSRYIPQAERLFEKG
ncbi:MAG: Trk system potassium transporter TrkA [Rhodothermales bacterium]